MKHLQNFIRTWISHPILQITLGLLLCVFCLSTFISKYRQHAMFKQQVYSLYQKNHLHQLQNEKTKTLVERLKKADPDYIQNTLEKKVFLAGEIQRLEAVTPIDQERLEDNKRLFQLKEGANQLKFSETHFQRIDNFQEVEVSQKQEVEMGSEDLIKLLSILENSQIGDALPDPKAPDFLVDTFELTRTSQPTQEEVFTIKLHCIKREYIHE